MALRTTCVHERKVETADGIHSRGPMIMPRGSWCFACDGQGKNGSWKPARRLSYADVDRLINDVDPKQWNGTKWVRSRYAIEGEFLPPHEVAYKVNVHLPRNCILLKEDVEAARAVGEAIRKKIEESFDREYFYGPGTPMRVLESFEEAERWSTVSFKPMWKVMDPIKETKGASEAVNFRGVDTTGSTVEGTLRSFSETHVLLHNTTFQPTAYAILVGSDLEDFRKLKRLKQLNAELEAANNERRRCQKNAANMQDQAQRATELRDRISEERYGLLSKLGVKADFTN